MAEQWPRDLWLDAIWEDPGLKPNERLVAYAYARYAGRGDTSWCSWEELRARTGIRSRDAIWRAIAGLVDKEWLQQVDPARQHRSPVYRLIVPMSVPVDNPPVETVDNSPGVRETDASGVRETDAWRSRGPGKRRQGSGILRSGVRLTDPIEQIENSDEKSDLARDAARSPSGAQPACGQCRDRRWVTVQAGCMERCPSCSGEAA